MLDNIVDHKILTNAVQKEDDMFTTARGLQHKKRTTAGWQLYVTWTNESVDWIALKDLKASYPV